MRGSSGQSTGIRRDSSGWTAGRQAGYHECRRWL